mgnify:CR=1 FL=1
MIPHLGLQVVERDIEAVAAPCRESGVLSKVIIEAALLTDEEKITACTLSKAACTVFFIKTGLSSKDSSLRGTVAKASSGETKKKAYRAERPTSRTRAKSRSERSFSRAARQAMPFS